MSPFAKGDLCWLAGWKRGGHGGWSRALPRPRVMLTEQFLKFGDPGEVRGRQGVSLPGADLALPSFTEADARGCELAREIKPHWVAISFVLS